MFAQRAIIKEFLWIADWSPNGKLIAIGRNINKLNIYSESKLKPFKSFHIKNTITRVRWNPSINIIAITTQNSK